MPCRRLGTGRCGPGNGTCDCNEDTAGAKRTCSDGNEIGTCYGFETCDPAIGWGDCDAPVAAVESCNGFDDNCDGCIDEGYDPATCNPLEEFDRDNPGPCQDPVTDD